MSSKKPSARAKKYIQNKIAGMSDQQAALKAGYSPSTAIAASNNIESPRVKELMADILDRKGLTDDKLADSLKEGLENANRIHGTDDNFVEVPDYPTRHRYLETALDLKGLKKSGETTIHIDAKTQILSLDLPADELADFIKWRDEQRRKALS